MSSGTKILLAVVTLFVGTLVVYYGFVMPSDEESPPAEEVLVAADLEAPAPRRTERAAEETPVPVPVEVDDRLADRTPVREPDAMAVLPTATPRTAAPTEPMPVDLDRAEGNPVAAGEPGPIGDDPGRIAVMDEGASHIIGTERDLPEDRPAASTPAPARETTTRRVPVGPKYTPYTVKDGDTMTSIAEWWFDDHRKWDLIAKANLVDPNRLRVGQVLRLPQRGSTRPPVERGTGADRVVHTVGPGETLSSIAVAHYGDIAKWERIYEANRSAIGVNPDALKVGMKLTIPTAS